MNCPLCGKPECEPWGQDKLRSYYKCLSCQLIYVPRKSIIASDAEKKRYDAHDNSEQNHHYEIYLRKIRDAIAPELLSESLGLDFGCGKTKILQRLFHEAGFAMDSYDLYFYPLESIWQNKYDFIILSEVIEHLRDPAQTMLNLGRLLKGNGQLFIKTKVYPQEKSEFNDWFYKRDVTHVQFFNQASFVYLAELLALSGPEEIGEDLFKFKG